jgi:AcrR family transcriptional regulator
MGATTAGRRVQTQQRRGDRQELLLDTVERLLADRNFRDLTVADVMVEAGLPRTTFYRHFPDLEAILLLGVARVSQELGDAAALWLNDVTDPIGSLRPSAAALIKVYVAHGRLLLAFAEAASSAPAVEKAWQAAIGGFIDLATARIEELVAAGRTDLSHPHETATALIWMTERYLLETYGRGPGLPSSTAIYVLDLVWRRTLFP